MIRILILLVCFVSLQTYANECDQLFKTTLDYYNNHAQEYNETRAHVSPELQAQRMSFINDLKPKSKILEIGAGHGRDALFFKEQGFRIVATEPSTELSKIAEAKINEPVLNLTAQEIQFKEEFDGIWAMASLIHVPANELPQVFIRLRDALKKDGVIHASFLRGVGKDDVAETLEDGRYFNRVSEKTLRKIISEIEGLEIDEALTSSQKNDYFGSIAPTKQFGFFNLVLRKR